MARRADRREPVPRDGDRARAQILTRLQARFGYTYSNLHNNGAESAQGGNGVNAGVQNPADPLEWQLSADDTPHVFLTGFTWGVPGPKSGISGMVLGGWNISGILRYESGRPLNVTINNDLGGLIFNGQKRPNRVDGVDGVAADSDFDPNVDRYFDRAAWTDPGPQAMGNAPKRDGTVRSFPVYSEDLNIFKVFPLPNGQRIRFESMFGNIFNRTLFCDPNTNWSAGAISA